MGGDLSPDREALVRDHVGLARRYARWWWRAHPGPCRRWPREDLEQESFLALVRAARSYDPARGAAFPTYLLWVMRSHLCGVTRRDARLRTLADPARLDRAAPPASDDWSEELRLLRRELDALDPARRGLLAAYYGLGGGAARRLGDLAGELGLTREAVRQRALHVRQKLRARLGRIADSFGG